jgi:hypothetical protein
VCERALDTAAHSGVGKVPGQPMARLPPDRLALQGANFMGMAGGAAACENLHMTTHAGKEGPGQPSHRLAHGAAFDKRVFLWA